MRHRQSPVRTLLVIGLVLAGGGCLPPLDNLDQGPLNSTFAVSDYYTPSGYMGDGAYLGLLTQKVNQGCRPRPAGAQGNCYVFTYNPNTFGRDPWAGVFWVFPSNSWGSMYGHAIDTAPFKQIRFWAAIEGPTPFTENGGLPISFNGLVGGINPNGGFASTGLPEHKDGVKASFGAVIGTDIGPEFKQFHIPLTDAVKGSECTGNPSCTPPGETVFGLATDLIAAFGWAFHYPDDGPGCKPDKLIGARCPTDQFAAPPAPVRVFLDDIVWDTQDPPP
jgi:hypothetical protein